MPRLKLVRAGSRNSCRRIQGIQLLFLTGVMSLVSSAALAQSFDCSKAQTPTERAICASPELINLDLTLAHAYSQSLDAARAGPARTQQLHESQRTWIGVRDRSCAATETNAARFGACLADVYRLRMASLSSSPSDAEQLPAAPPAPAARLSISSVPASTDGEALATVTSAGRFSIRAASKTGVAVQLVDMITGPGDIAGDAGTRDGRLDVLLDKGVYKLRTFGAKDAAGEATLTIEPFRDIAPADGSLLRGGQTSGELADLQQRSFWVIVDASHPIAVEAAGRSLQDMRAWRNGVELAELAPPVATIEPKAGHPLTRLRLEGALEPGLYLVTTYGGAPQSWADGDTAQPLHVRIGPPTLMAADWFEGVLGPLGSQRFEVPAPASYLRLDLPEQATARLSARRAGGGSTVATITKNSREPTASASLSTNGQNPAFVEVSGLEGQKFRLRALNPASSLRLGAAGSYLLAVDVAGEGADEVPATAVLARYENGAGQVMVSDAPRVGPGTAWRRKFNLRGPTTLIFEGTGSGPVAAVARGPGVRMTLDTLAGGNAPRVDGESPQRWEVDSGWYVLRLDPVAGAAGVIDLTFGQPGLAVDPSPAPPARTVIDLGRQTIDRSTYYQAYVNSAPGLVTGPRARALPADLSSTPLSVQQPARAAAIVQPTAPNAPAPARVPPRVAPAPVQPTPAPKPKGATARPQTPKAAPSTQRVVAPKPLPPRPSPAVLPPRTAALDGSLVIPIRIPTGGRLVATDQTSNPMDVAVATQGVDKDIISATVTIPPSESERTIVLAFVKNEPPVAMPKVVTEDFGDPLAAGVAAFFDLKETESRRFLLNAPEGGLYRLETLGRLKTNVSVSTSFSPRLATAGDNGAGHNALLQTYLRAGAYRVGVAAYDSSGRLGLVAKPAALINAGALVPDGRVRATLASGAGATIAIDIVKPGEYRIDLHGLDRTFSARLEDAEGWPLMRPGPLDTLQRRFEAGRYRLVVLPQDVDARLVARLRSANPEPSPEGHGPHQLPFGIEQAFQWREPSARDAPRTPDRWTFDLQGPSHVTLDVSDGVIGDLVEVTGEPKPIGKIVYKRGFANMLPAGHYAVEARALGRNDRLDYTISLGAAELQPGQKRSVALPASIPISIAQDRVVSVTTFGRRELSAILRDSDGGVIERLTGRADDWNIALSRLLSAGTYRIDLSESKSAQKSDSDASSDDDDQSSSDGEDKRPATASSRDDETEGAIELHLDLPRPAPAQTLDLTAFKSVTGPRVHRFDLPAIPAATLLTVGARSLNELVLSLERRDASGAWRAEAFDRGRTPIVAAPADADTNPWRVSVWAIDGGAADITIGARSVADAAQALGDINLKPVAIDGLDLPLRAALVAAPRKSIVILKERYSGLFQGSRPGRPLVAAESGTLAPQSEGLWLLARNDALKSVHLDAVAGDAKDIALELAAGDVATLRASPVADETQRVWRAFSTFGQPGIDAGRGFGVAQGGAFAVAGEAPLRVWNAGSNDALRLRVDSLDVAMRKPASTTGHYSSVLAPHSAQPVQLPPGGKQVRVDLAANTAAHLSGGNRDVTVWAGGSAMTRQLADDWTQALLINAGEQPAPASIDVIDTNEQPRLAAGLAVKRFFGAAGSLSLPTRAEAGDTLVTAGGAPTFIGNDGRVSSGPRMALNGPGELVIAHAPGLVAAWIENATATPWALASATPIALPQVASLSGAAQAFALAAKTAVLLHARTNAPAILSLQQGVARGAPELFPLGAEFHRYLAAGAAELRLYSPQDGPLSGELELTATPVTEIAEGIGEPQALAPGSMALFGFEVKRAANIGVGVRSDPDRASARLLDSSGRRIGEGVAQLQTLQPGHYLLEARAPADGETLTVRPAVVGLTPPDNGPPPDVTSRYLELVGLSPTRVR